MTTFMIIYATIAGVAFLFLVSSLIFGADSDADADADVDMDMDVDADMSYEGASDYTVSIFSTKVIGTILMGYGIGGFLGSYYGLNHGLCTLIGLLSGGSLGACMFWLLKFFASQQGSSSISVREMLGLEATVTVPIPKDGPGEISFHLRDQFINRMARGSGGMEHLRGLLARGRSEDRHRGTSFRRSDVWVRR